jgi:hypothetical protein
MADDIPWSILIQPCDANNQPFVGSSIGNKLVKAWVTLTHNSASNTTGPVPPDGKPVWIQFNAGRKTDPTFDQKSSPSIMVGLLIGKFQNGKFNWDNSGTTGSFGIYQYEIKDGTWLQHPTGPYSKFDSVLTLVFDPNYFALASEFNLNPNPFLNKLDIGLPAPVGDFHQNLEVYARLWVGELGGTSDGVSWSDSVLDIVAEHKSVPDDGTSSQITNTCYGVTNVYPYDNDKFPPAIAPAFSGSFSVYLHRTVGVALNAKCGKTFNASSILCDKVTQVFTRFFTGVSVQFDAGDTISNFFVQAPTPPGQPAGTGCWATPKAVASCFDADGTPHLTSDKKGLIVPTPDCYATIPFFTFYVVAGRQIVPAGKECGDSGLLLSGKDYTDGQGNRRVLSPILLVWPPQDEGPDSQGRPYNPTMYPDQQKSILDSLAADEDRLNSFADTICHEIGHALGLRHGLYYVPPSTYMLDAPPDVQPHQRGTMSYRGNEADSTYSPPNFGVVHEFVIRQLFPPPPPPPKNPS